jgi:hypothetical protein
MSDLWWEAEQLRQLRGACSCGDSTILGVIHTDTQPCYLPMVHRPLTDEEIWKICKATSGSQVDLARAIEKAHGIGGINEI